MTDRHGVTAPRLLQCLGGGSVLYGAVLLAAPRAVTALVGGRPPATAIVRVLGVRQLAQGAALLARPARATVAVSAAVDGLHALTMVAAAVRWPAQRRSAVVSGAVALTSGVLAVMSVMSVRSAG